MIAEIRSSSKGAITSCEKSGALTDAQGDFTMSCSLLCVIDEMDVVVGNLWTM